MSRVADSPHQESTFASSSNLTPCPTHACRWIHGHTLTHTFRGHHRGCLGFHSTLTFPLNVFICILTAEDRQVEIECRVHKIAHTTLTKFNTSNVFLRVLLEMVTQKQERRISGWYSTVGTPLKL